MSDGVELPLFSEDFLRGNNSLGAAVGNVYKNVSFPFTKNQKGYWEFDSMNEEQSVRLYQDSDTGYIWNGLEKTAITILQQKVRKKDLIISLLTDSFHIIQPMENIRMSKNPARVGNLGVNYLFWHTLYHSLYLTGRQ